MEDLLKDFIEWAHENSPDAWWIYEHTDEAIKMFLEQRDKNQNDSQLNNPPS